MRREVCIECGGYFDAQDMSPCGIDVIDGVPETAWICRACAACAEAAAAGLNEALEDERKAMEERMLKWFEYQHLPEHLQVVSQVFHNAACWLVENVEPGPERTVALRKLLEAKDAAVRAKLQPGG